VTVLFVAEWIRDYALIHRADFGSKLLQHALPGRLILATLTARPEPQKAEQRGRTTLAYWALLTFTFLYYARPEDFIPGLNYIPLAKISAGLALLGLFAAWRPGRTKFPREIKLLLALFFYLSLTVPFAFWRGGAFVTVAFTFGKGVIVAILTAMLVNRTSQLRKLIFTQTTAVSFMTIASILAHHTDNVGRLTGVSNGILENPNDLAINVAINLSFCLAFLLRARDLRKSLWAFPLLAMVYAVLITYSRSGFLALIVGVLFCLWEFGVKGRRLYLILLAGVLAVGTAVFAPSHYYARLQSIFLGPVEGANDNGSAEARRELLQTSLQLMAQHPLFGVGPGNFPVVTGSWKVAHNTYTQMGAEGGIPSLILFLLVIGTAFRSVLLARRSSLYKHDRDFRILVGALFSAFGAYFVGAFFSDTAYNLFPYFLIGYASVVRRIAEAQKMPLDISVRRPDLWKQVSLRKSYVRP
jgi:O-antigen ligase